MEDRRGNADGMPASKEPCRRQGSPWLVRLAGAVVVPTVAVATVTMATVAGACPPPRGSDISLGTPAPQPPADGQIGPAESRVEARSAGTAHVYLDTTGSMRGYLDIPPSSALAQHFHFTRLAQMVEEETRATLRMKQRLVAAAERFEEIDGARFDSFISTRCVLADSTTTRRASKPSKPSSADPCTVPGQYPARVYTGQYLRFGELVQDFSVKSRNPQDVLIFISDMFFYNPNNVAGDISEFKRAIEEFLQPSDAVALLSAWTAFNGKILDLPSHLRPEDPHVEVLMPLHVLMAGNREAVSRLAGAFRNRLDPPPNTVTPIVPRADKNNGENWHLVAFDPTFQVRSSVGEASPVQTKTRIAPVHNRDALRDGVLRYQVKLTSGEGALDPGIGFMWPIQGQDRAAPIAAKYDVSLRAWSLMDRDECRWDELEAQSIEKLLAVAPWTADGSPGKVILNTMLTGAKVIGNKTYAVEFLLNEKGQARSPAEDRFLDEKERWTLPEGKVRDRFAEYHSIRDQGRDGSGRRDVDADRGPFRFGTLNLNLVHEFLWRRTYMKHITENGIGSDKGIARDAKMLVIDINR